MDNILVLLVVGVLSGVCASLGIGGGFILLLYITVFTQIPQLQAQYINLLFFIPIAILSVILHNKNKLIVKDILLPTIISGIIGVGLGAVMAHYFDGAILSKLFAVFILAVGIMGLFPFKHKGKLSKQE